MAARDAVAAISGRGNSDRRTAAIAPADAGRERARHVGHAGGHHEARGTAFRGTHTLAARRQHRLDGHREGLTDWAIAIIAVGHGAGDGGGANGEGRAGSWRAVHRR